jgi:microcystin-dependent protein
LGTDGRPQGEIWLTYGFNYKFVLKDSAGVTIQTYDNLYGIVGTQGAVGTTIPAGMISLWYGSIGSVPTGWYLCDGTNGTPDLRDKFVIAAGSSYAVGATGGTATNTLTTNELPTHSHTATFTGSALAGHAHTIGGAFGGGGGIGGGDLNNSLGSTSTSSVSAGTPSGTVAVASTGSGASFSNIPPYYALAYVMKS